MFNGPRLWYQLDTKSSPLSQSVAHTVPRPTTTGASVRPQQFNAIESVSLFYYLCSEPAFLKRVIAITLIALILFNTMGFYGLFVGLRYKAKRDIVHRVDRDDYQHNELITFKIPLAIPYHNGDDQYQKLDGEIQHEGEFYRLIKQKLAQDTLYIVCIKDAQSKHIKRALSDYVKSFTDKPADGKSQSKTLLSFIKDFIVAPFSFHNGSAGWNRLIATNFSAFFLFDNTTIAIDGPPPKA